MLLNEDFNEELPVDRREELVTTQQPGYASTEKVIQDIAAERRLALYLINRFLWTVLSFLEILLAFRFVLRLIGANPDSGFAILMYGFTGLFVAPFNGLVPNPISGGAILEVTTLIAMVVYAMIFWGIAYFVRMVTSLPMARTFTRTVLEQRQIGDGTIRTTHTTVSNKKM